MQPRTGSAISELRVADLMTKPVVTLEPHLTAREAARVLDEQGVSGAPVVNRRGQILGVVSQSDLVHQGARRETVGELGRFFSDVDDYRELGSLQGEALSTPIEKVMTREVVSVEDETPISVAATVMRGRAIHRLLVTHDGALVGIVTTHDLLRALEAPPQET